MKRSFTLAVVAFALCTGCGGGKQVSSTTPSPAPSYAPGGAPAYQNGKYPLLGPAGKARDTVDRLEDAQNRTEQQGEGMYP